MAFDEYNVSSAEIDVGIVYCTGCSDHGTCDFNSTREVETGTDTFYLATCICREYWEGNSVCFYNLLKTSLLESNEVA